MGMAGKLGSLTEVDLRHVWNDEACGFRPKSTTGSEPNRPPVPKEIVHLFRMKSTTNSVSSRPPVTLKSTTHSGQIDHLLLGQKV